MNWPKEMIEEYQEFYESQECTRAHKLIELFFETKMPPCYFAGNLIKAKFGLLGLNPGYGPGRENELKAVRKGNWQDFYLNFFNIFHQELHLESKYYTQFSVLLSGVLGKSPNLSVSERYTLLHENLVNFDIIPYHSKRFTVKITEEKLKHIKPYIRITSDLIKKSSTEYLFFNGGPWESFLSGDKPILKNTIDLEDSFIINPDNKLKIKAHFGTCLGRKMVWFDKFLNARGSGMSYDILYETGQKIREYYGIK